LLGQVSPEAAPFAVGWTRKFVEKANAYEAALKDTVAPLKKAELYRKLLLDQAICEKCGGKLKYERHRVLGDYGCHCACCGDWTIEEIA